MSAKMNIVELLLCIATIYGLEGDVSQFTVLLPLHP